MAKSLANLDNCKSELIQEILALPVVKPLHLTRTLELLYDLNKMAHQIFDCIESRKGIDLSQERCVLKSEIYCFARLSRTTFKSHINYLEITFYSFQRCPIPTNITINFQETSENDLVASITNSLNPFGVDEEPAWIYEFNGKLNTNSLTRPVLHSAIDNLTRKLHFYCITTQAGIHEFDLTKHSITNIIPFVYEPYGICVDSLYVYVLTSEGRPFSNGIMKINKSTKEIVKRWSERSKPEFTGFQTDGVDSLFTLRANSLCVFSKITLSQLRELKLTNKLKPNDKIRGFSVFIDFLYILPQDILFDILVYSLLNGELLRTISLQLDHVCTQICLNSFGHILCLNDRASKAFLSLFNTKGELIHEFSLKDENVKVIGMNFIEPYLIVLCVLSNESIKIFAY